jgi:hypothetical protein
MSTTRFSTGVKLGPSTNDSFTNFKVYTQTLTPASVGAATVAEQTFTVTGLTTADKVIVNAGAILNAVSIGNVRVSAANTLAVQFCNPTAGALTPTAVTWNILAFRTTNP